MPLFEYRITIKAEGEPSTRKLKDAIEESLIDDRAQVKAITETVTCFQCQETAEITTTYKADKKRSWWHIFGVSKDRKYALSSTHRCYQEAAKNYAPDDSPWHAVIAE